MCQYQIRFIAEIMLVVILAAALSAMGTYVLMTEELDRGFYSSEQKQVNIR